jgi:acyl-CoA hydrolase
MAKNMIHETHRLVLTEDLNQYGLLFGGRLLSWVDEASFIAASLEYPQRKFVTIGMDEVAFKFGVKNGSILVIRSQRKRLGKTSVTYTVEVFRGSDENDTQIFTTNVTFVNVDEAGVKCAI